VIQLLHMEFALEVLGFALVALGVAGAVVLIGAGHVWAIFKAAEENPLFAVAALGGMIFAGAGLLITGNLTVTGAIRGFENGAGWVLTIGGGLFIVVLLVAIGYEQIRSRRASSIPSSGTTDQTVADISASTPTESNAKSATIDDAGADYISKQD
jgi:hypothetical protein